LKHLTKEQIEEIKQKGHWKGHWVVHFITLCGEMHNVFSSAPK
jgi:hypothetical protein